MNEPGNPADKTAHNRILQARTALVLEHPFFASLALRLEVQEDPSCQTAWTNGKIFGYNPSYVRCLDHKKLLGLCAHTVMHPACGHHTRRNQRDPSLWNKACDLAINPILRDAGISLPDGFLLEERFRDKTADAIYEAMVSEKNREEQSPEPGDQSPESFQEKDNASSDISIQKESQDSIAVREEDSPEATQDPGMSGEVRDQTDAKQGADPQEPSTDWEQALVQAAATARAMGKLPRSIDRLVEHVISPKLGWKELLSRFIQQSARSDYSWTSPNRRYIHKNLYFPSLSNHQLSDLVVAVDTSGSIQAQELDQFAAELSAILAAFPARLHLLYTDMRVHKYQVLEQWDLPLVFEAKGGGGTDFRPAFAAVSENQIHPACFIYLTDLECRLFPSKKPFFPTLWVKTGQKGVTPPFGQVIHLTP